MLRCFQDIRSQISKNINYAVRVFIDYTSVILVEDRRMRLQNKDHHHGSPQEPSKVNRQAKIDEPMLTTQDSSTFVLYELRKKINQLLERLDESERKNEQRHTELLAQLAGP